MKNLFAIIGFITAAGIGTGVYLWWKRPKLLATPDYEKKSVTYAISAGGESMAGTKDFSDKTTTEKVTGDWKMVVSAEGTGFVLAIFKAGVMVRGDMIDLDKKTIKQLA